MVPTRASLLRGIVVPLLALHAIAASPVRRAGPSKCQSCLACGTEVARSRAVHVWVFNQSRLKTNDLADILTIANRIWAPYSVSMEAGTDADAIKIIVSDHLMRPDNSPAPVPLGDTLFADGHATPYIHLWLGAAERLASNAEIEGRTFASRSLDERDSILRRILGVALAHELGHYLLDTASHSSAGLLRETLGIEDLARPAPGYLRLTNAQQQLICSHG